MRGAVFVAQLHHARCHQDFPPACAVRQNGEQAQRRFKPRRVGIEGVVDQDRAVRLAFDLEAVRNLRHRFQRRNHMAGRQAQRHRRREGHRHILPVMQSVKRRFEFERLAAPANVNAQPVRRLFGLFDRDITHIAVADNYETRAVLMGECLCVFGG